MNWIFKIAPRELRLIDVYLRENYPWIWATRIHFTVYLTILLGVFAALIGLITPVDVQNPMSSGDIMTFFGVFMFPTIILMGYIIFQLCLFSVEKRKGKSSFFRPLFVFPLMMFSVVSPLIMPYSISFVLNEKVGNLAEEEQLKQDVIDLQKAKYFVNSGEGDYKYFGTEKEYLRYWSLDQEPRDNIKNYRKTFKKAIYYHEDEHINVRPRLYKVKNYSSGYNSYYSSYSGWDFDEEVHFKNEVKQFYHEQNLDLSFVQAEKYLHHLNFCIDRYTDYESIDVGRIIDELENNIYSDCYSNTRRNRSGSYNYDVLIVNDSFNESSKNLGHIKRAQLNYLPSHTDVIFLGFLWASFIITLLLFIFKLVHWKQFLLSILIIGIYLTIIGIIEVVGRFKGEFFPIMAILFVVASIIFLNKAWGLQKFSVVVNQMAIVAFMSLPFFPIMILAYLTQQMDVFEISYFDQYLIKNTDAYRPYSQEYYDLIEVIWLNTFWVGIIFFYLLGLPYLKKVFLRLMSLPKKN
jgi:MFS family permease